MTRSAAPSPSRRRPPPPRRTSAVSLASRRTVDCAVACDVKPAAAVDVHRAAVHAGGVVQRRADDQIRDAVAADVPHHHAEPKRSPAAVPRKIALAVAEKRGEGEAPSGPKNTNTAPASEPAPSSSGAPTTRSATWSAFRSPDASWREVDARDRRAHDEIGAVACSRPRGRTASRRTATRCRRRRALHRPRRRR